MPPKATLGPKGMDREPRRIRKRLILIIYKFNVVSHCLFSPIFSKRTKAVATKSASADNVISSAALTHLVLEEGPHGLGLTLSNFLCFEQLHPLVRVVVLFKCPDSRNHMKVDFLKSMGRPMAFFCD